MNNEQNKLLNESLEKEHSENSAENNSEGNEKQDIAKTLPAFSRLTELAEKRKNELQNS